MRRLFTGLIFSITFIVLPFLTLPFFVPAQQLWTREFATSAVDLFLSAYSLEATILFAFLIYKMQKEDMEKEHKKRLAFAKSAMGTALESGIKWILYPESSGYPGIASTTREVFTEYMPELQELLNLEQYRYLMKSVELIDASVHSEERNPGNVQAFIRDWLWMLPCSKYFGYFEAVSDEHVILNKRTFELLNALGMEENSFEKTDMIYDMSGNPLFVKGKCLGEYTIYDGEQLIFNGKLDFDDLDRVCIVEGYEKSEKYIGYYKDGKFHGEGCEYDWQGEKYREGIFEQGELYKGIEYHWIVKFDGEEYEKYLQAGNESFSVMMLDQEIEYEGMDKFFVVDLQVEGDEEWIVRKEPLEEYLENGG